MKWIEVEISIDVRQKESTLLPTKVVPTSDAGTLLGEPPTNSFIWDRAVEAKRYFNH